MKCENCGAEFDPRHGLQKYCSAECAQAVKLAQNREYSRRHHVGSTVVVKCAVCGKEFTARATNIKTCSEECRKKYRATAYHEKKPARKVKCKICGREFETKSNRQQCCSEACSLQNSYNHCRERYYRVGKPARALARAERKYGKSEPRKCEHCGKEYKPTTVAQRYCCRACYESARHHEPPPEPAEPKKPMSEWVKEAAECNLDYGTYRAFRNMGKTYEELKATASNRQAAAHNRMGTKRVTSSGTVTWARLIC